MQFMIPKFLNELIAFEMFLSSNGTGQGGELEE